ncbi:MAG: DmsC/YnfH family molybdoenzyme membrane anchor subunit [Pseudomonadota bacterium]
MHPAISVIFFTVTSGAGFGFIALIGLGVPLPESGIGAFAACFIAGILSVAGLVSSTFHLGHPERAWRAFSQWRSSWLSREGVFAVVTLVLFGIYGLFWVFGGIRLGWLGFLIAIGSVLTIYATAMIYAQLKTIPSWNCGLTPICYLLFALAGGILLAAGFGIWEKMAGVSVPAIAFVALLIAWGSKIAWWKRSKADNLAARGSDTGTATGLGTIGEVRLLEKPHSGENYLTKEMVHKIGRKHADKLRMIAILIGAIIPLLIVLTTLIASLPNALLLLAFVCLLAGLFVERWLFFAEAKHAVSLYY